jgi:hypothetical protein
MRIALCVLILAVTTLALTAQEPAAKGWLEGRVVDEDGKAIGDAACGPCGARIRLLGPDKVAANSEMGANGLFSFRDLKPGVYEVLVDATRKGEVRHRPQRLFGVMVKPGARTMLDITVHPGEALEEVGKPVFVMQPVVIVSNALDRLQTQIDELKKK